MVNIPGWSEDWSGGSLAATLTAANTGADSEVGTGAGVFAAGLAGSGQSGRFTVSGGVFYNLRYDDTAKDGIWLGFELQLASTPTVNVSLLQFASGSTIVATMRGKSDGTLDFRDGSTARTATPVLTLGKRYWVTIFLDVGSTVSQFNVYDGTTGDPVLESGNIATNNTGATSVDNLRIGIPANPSGAADVYFGEMIADTATEPADPNYSPGGGGGPVPAGWGEYKLYQRDPA